MDPRSGITAKLTVDNWSTWSKQFSAHLMSKGLYKYIADVDSLVASKEFAIIGTTASEAASSETVLSLSTAQLKESAAIREKDLIKLLTFVDSEDVQAKGTLLQYLSTERFSFATSSLPLGTSTTKQLYDALKTYAEETENPKVQIRQQQFRMLRQGTSEPLIDYLARLDDIQSNLRDSGNAYTQVAMYDKLQESLLPEFLLELQLQRNFVSNKKDAPIYDWLCHKLLIHENAKKLRELTMPAHQPQRVFVAADAPLLPRNVPADANAKQYRYDPDTNAPICIKCGDSGHIGRFCWREKEVQRQLQQAQPQQQAHIQHQPKQHRPRNGKHKYQNQQALQRPEMPHERAMYVQDAHLQFQNARSAHDTYDYQQSYQQPNQSVNPSRYQPSHASSSMYASQGRPQQAPAAYQDELPPWLIEQREHHAYLAHQGRVQPRPHYNPQNPEHRTNDNGAWFVDSGCSGHMTPELALFDEYHELKVNVPVEFGGGEIVPAIGYGHITLPNRVRLFNVLYVPALTVSLLSISATLHTGLDVLFRSRGRDVVFLAGNTPVMSGTQKGSLFVLDSMLQVSESALIVQQKQTPQLWHRRYAHLNYAALANMQRLKLIPGCTVTPAAFLQAAMEPCEPCIQAKAIRISHPTNEDSETVPLGLVAFDLTGPVQNGMNGEVYFIGAVDTASGMSRGQCLKQKCEANSFVMETIVLWERQVQAPGMHKVQRVRTDNGGEFCNNELDLFFRERGIVHETTTPYTSVQNPRAERMMRSVMTTVRALLRDSRLSARFWPYAAMLAVDMHNWSVNAQKKMSPFERFHGRKPVTKHIKPFGSPAWLLLPHEHLRKFDERVRTEGVFVGYKQPAGSMQYLVLVRGKIYSSCNVTFSEAAPAVPDVRVPSVVFASSVHSTAMHPTANLSISNVHSHNSETTTSHCATTADSVASYDLSLSESDDSSAPVDVHIPMQPLQYINNPVYADDVAYEPAQQVLAGPRDVEAMQVPAALMQSDPINRAATRRTKNSNWRT